MKTSLSGLKMFMSITQITLLMINVVNIIYLKLYLDVIYARDMDF